MAALNRTYWLAALSAAEAAGITVVATAYAAVDRSLVGAGAPTVLLAGMVEGLCLGLAQGLGLRRLGARLGPWVALTVVAAVLGYGLSLLGQAGGDETEAAAFDPPIWLMVLAGGGLGMGMGAAMGLIQAPALPRCIRRGHWVYANVIGWVPAMAAIMTGAGSVGRDWPLWQVALTGAISGAVAGLCVAWATWVAIRRAEI